MTKVEKVDVSTRAGRNGLAPAAYGRPEAPRRGPAEVASELQFKEADAASCILDEMSELQRRHPDWFHSMEDTDPDVASSDELLALLRDAPTAFAKGLIFGKFQLRMELAALTGRSF